MGWRDGLMDGYLYIYCLPPAGGRYAPTVINAPTAQSKVINAPTAQGERGWREGTEGEGRVYEAYEVKNKRQKLRCLLLRRKKKNIFYLFMKSLLWKKFLNGH